MSLQRRREQYSIIMIFKILHHLVPNDLDIVFTNSDRRGIRIKIPSVHKGAKIKYITQYDDSFKIRASNLWNSIPAEVTKKASMESFKIALSKYLITFPDHPPIQGQASKNSLLDYNRTNAVAFQ